MRPLVKMAIQLHHTSRVTRLAAVTKRNSDDKLQRCGAAHTQMSLSGKLHFGWLQ